MQQAAAANGELGLLEGKAVALLNPALMAGLYLTTLYTGYQGLKWREVRTVGDDLKALQAQAKPYEARIAAAGEAGDASASAALAPLQSQISELTAKRKDMLAAGYRDKHWALASVLLACGVTFSIEGGVDTYMRVGKLFPGPHLFAGAGITVLWAVAAALVPKMQKGEDWARTAHIGINVAILGLFTWQLQSGFEILDKVGPSAPVNKSRITTSPYEPVASVSDHTARMRRCGTRFHGCLLSRPSRPSPSKRGCFVV